MSRRETLWNLNLTLSLMIRILCGVGPSHVPFPVNNIILNHRNAPTEQVYDDGESMGW
jgi:hypothetical protein